MLLCFSLSELTFLERKMEKHGYCEAAIAFLLVEFSGNHIAIDLLPLPLIKSIDFFSNPYENYISIWLQSLRF